jgi:hypothetical protein
MVMWASQIDDEVDLFNPAYACAAAAAGEHGEFYRVIGKRKLD